jgi:anti-sigma regulatory factor (Ser/Thr protein kinase)
VDLALRLGMTPTAPAEARRSLDSFASSLTPERLDDLRLVLSELVTNCVRHSGQGEAEWIDVTVKWLGSTVRIEVSDPGLWREPGGSRPQDSEGGWGLLLVDRLAARWGHQSEPHTRVWAEMAVS